MPKFIFECVQNYPKNWNLVLINNQLDVNIKSKFILKKKTPKKWERRNGNS